MPPPKIFLSQRTDRHVVKNLSIFQIYENSFGTFGTIQIDNTGLNFPRGMAADDSNNIFICDMLNQRIVKLDSDLTWIDFIDVSTEIGIPYAIFFETSSTDLYVVGIKDNITISIARIPQTLASISKFNSNIYPAENNKPLAISTDYSAGYFLISGMDNLLKVQEITSTFNTAVTQAITGEENSKFNGHVMHTDGFLYMNTLRSDGSRISRVNNLYQNTGDSNKISRLCSLVIQGYGGSLLTYDNANFVVKRYDTNLNWTVDVYSDTGSAVATDAENIYGILELETEAPPA